MGEKNTTAFPSMFGHHDLHPIPVKDGQIKVSSVQEEEIDM